MINFSLLWYTSNINEKALLIKISYINYKSVLILGGILNNENRNSKMV